MFVETIQILNGITQRIELHNDRCNRTRQRHYGVRNLEDLTSHIQLPQHMSTGLIKCRVLYDHAINEVSYQQYNPTKVSSLKIVHDNEVEYDDKASLRPDLDRLYALRECHDEIIIVKNGLITDAYYYNVAFRKRDQWFTPQAPLLKGVMRQSLLNQGKLTEIDIHESEILDYDQVALFNALNEFGEVMFPVENIF